MRTFSPGDNSVFALSIDNPESLLLTHVEFMPEAVVIVREDKFIDR